MKSTLLAAFLFALTLLCPSRPSNAGDEDVLRSIVDGYRANRDSFRFMTCRSVVTHGKAESMEQALAGDYLPGDRIVAQGFYAKQRKTERTDLIYPSELQEKFKVQASDHTFTTSFVSERQLGDGRLVAMHFPDNTQANIAERDRNWLSYNLVRPFDMGLNGKNEMMALDSLIEAALAGPGATYEGEEKLDGRGTWVVTCSAAHGAEIRVWIDQERGFLPVKEEIRFRNELLYSFRLLEVQRCSQGRWLPIRGVTAFKPAKVGAPATFRDVRISQYEVDQPPPPEALRLDLPPGTSVTDMRTMAPWSSGKDGAPLYLDLADPPTRANQQTANTNTSKGQGRTSLGDFAYTQRESTQPSSRLGRWLFRALVVLLVLAAAFVVIRKRRGA